MITPDFFDTGPSPCIFECVGCGRQLTTRLVDHPYEAAEIAEDSGWFFDGDLWWCQRCADGDEEDWDAED